MIETIEISKEDYELEDEEWISILAEKYGFDAVKTFDALDVQRNFDGKKYTIDIFYAE